MIIRLVKIGLAVGIAFYLALVVVNNLTDYASNRAFVAHVLAMDTTFPANAGMWRAIPGAWAVRVFYLSIIAWEMAALGLILTGVLRMARAARDSAAAFGRAKQLALAGLALNMLQWLVAFIAVGGEWFLMWQSRSWNAIDTAGRMFLVTGVVLLFVSGREEEEAE